MDLAARGAMLREMSVDLPRRSLSTVLPLVLLWAILGGAVAAGSPDDAPALEYRVGYDPETAALRVRLCVRGFEPGPLVVDYDETLEHLGLPAGLTFNRGRSDEVGTPTGGEGRGAYGVTVPSMPGGCFEYGVDLAALASGDRRSQTSKVGADWLTMPTRWLLRPARRPDGLVATISLVLPEGFAASVPWERLPGADGGESALRYRLDETVWRFEGLIALGRLETDVLSVGGARIEVAVLDRPHRATAAGIRRWLAEAARAVTTLYGRFPVDRVQVVVEPVTGGGSEPVRFGYSRQGGGGGVVLFLSATAADEELPGEWVAVHELTHLALPPIREADAWFYEGVVTYYQEVLRARAGMRSEAQAWQSIHDGFLRGIRRRTTRPLSEESADMRRTHSFHRVYWAGAALALRWDVSLRRTAGGRSSLDGAVRAVRERPDSAHRLWSAREVCEAMERATSTPFCTTSAEKSLASSDFPDFHDLYAALGVTVEDDTVVLKEDAPDATIRRAIMAPAPR